MLCIHPRRVRWLWRLRACVPGRGDLLRRRRARAVGPVHAANAKFSGQFGSPGGAAKTRPLPDGTDHVPSYVTSR